MLHLFRFTGQTFVEIHFCPSSSFHIVIIPNDLFATSCTDQHILFLCLLFFLNFSFFSTHSSSHIVYINFCSFQTHLTLSDQLGFQRVHVISPPFKVVIVPYRRLLWRSAFLILPFKHFREVVWLHKPVKGDLPSSVRLAL